MPRGARVQSEHDLYHITVRGINQVQLFYDDADRHAFLGRLWKYRDACEVKVLSWCLMANHVHLLVWAELPKISLFMKRLLLSFSHYYNRRYDRSGYLYQGRYGSVAIKDEAQLLTVTRYIHRNPLEAGRSVRDWTSYDDIEHSSGPTDSVDLLSLIDGDADKAVRAFVAFIEEERDDLESPAPRRRLSDEAASQIIKEVAGIRTCQALCDLSPSERNAALVRIKAGGPTIRQIARLTGLNRGVVQRAHASKETSVGRRGARIKRSVPLVHVPVKHVPPKHRMRNRPRKALRWQFPSGATQVMLSEGAMTA